MDSWFCIVRETQRLRERERNRLIGGMKRTESPLKDRDDCCFHYTYHRTKEGDREGVEIGRILEGILLVGDENGRDGEGGRRGRGRGRGRGGGGRRSVETV